jgi:hypothetical protein
MSAPVTEWTTATLKEHHEIIDRLKAQLDAERDRRYKEVAEEREKAAKIKERGDETALLLAREIQTYKDEKANDLRSQIDRERGTYATQSDIKMLTEKLVDVAAQVERNRNMFAPSTDVKIISEKLDALIGGGRGIEKLWGWITAGVIAAGAVFSAFWSSHK